MGKSPEIYAHNGSNYVKSTEQYVYVDDSLKYQPVTSIYSHNGEKWIESSGGNSGSQIPDLAQFPPTEYPTWAPYTNYSDTKPFTVCFYDLMNGGAFDWSFEAHPGETWLNIINDPERNVSREFIINGEQTILRKLSVNNGVVAYVYESDVDRGVYNSYRLGMKSVIYYDVDGKENNIEFAFTATDDDIFVRITDLVMPFVKYDCP